MSKSAVIVIGAGFGDEGKGLMTDYFVRQKKSPLAIRFNGGAQAGHTVVHPHGLGRHVFSHFGAGTLVGAGTFLSKDFIVNPILFNKEEKTLGVSSEVIVDSRCYVTTPFDMLINQALENHRAGKRHGSCGVGIGETVERQERSEFALTVEDLQRWDFTFKLWKICDNYMPHRCMQLGIAVPFFDAGDIIFKFGEEIKNFLKRVTVANSRSDYFHRFFEPEDTFVLEGAQGLRLDQRAPSFPHVTRSNTGLQNAAEVIRDLRTYDVEICYVTRCYVTRHGAGPLPHECQKSDIGYNIVEKTNVSNEFQQNFRYAFLDVNQLVKDVLYDMRFADSAPVHHEYTLSVAITCLDQVGELVPVVIDGFYKRLNHDELAREISTRTGAKKIYLSYGETRNDINVLTSYE